RNGLTGPSAWGEQNHLGGWPMNKLQYGTGAFRHARAQGASSPQQRAIGIAFAAIMEVGIVYALIVNLGHREAPPVLPPFNGYIIPDDMVVDPVPPPPAPKFDPPPISQPITEVVLEYTPPQPIAITPPPPAPIPIPTNPQVAAVFPPPVPVYTAARAIAATHTTPEYPSVARRLGQQGTLRLKLAVSEQGAVTDAVLVNSSGSDYLDKAAIDWVKKY